MRVLLVEPYASGSHLAWLDGYRRHSGHDIDVCALPGRFWRWRQRGSAVELAVAISSHVAKMGRPDALVVSSPTDLASLLGLARRSISGVPVVAYLHENQLAYPHRDAGDLDAAIRSWITLVAADRVVFNSAHHRAVVAAALPGLASAMPDGEVDLDPAWLLAKSTVVPVGIDFEALAARAAHAVRRSVPPLIVWNHRWDDDKAPEVFVRACQRLLAEGIEFRVALLGEDSWDGEPRRGAAAASLGAAVAQCGHLGHEAYRDVLSESDIVVSTARHEFFGVSVVEAIAAGSLPLLPNALSYPELIPVRWHDTVLYQPGTFGRRLADMVTGLDEARRATSGLAASMERFAWSAVAAQLDAVVTAATC